VAGAVGRIAFRRFTAEISLDIRRMEDTSTALTQARSMLILLLATCKQTLLALEAAGNVLDTNLTTELRAMIERSEGELEMLTDRIKGLPV
jgi:uncharacterized paraquat-inducible protein A